MLRVRASTTAARQFTELNDTEVERFESQLRGPVIRPGDAGYDVVRQLHNGMIDKRPALITRCVDVGDVIAAVNFARAHDVLVAVHGGGHSGPGLGLCDDGLVIDLSMLKGVHVNPAARTVRVAGGATWGEVDHATQAFGLAVPSGIISTTGVGGLTLGGGHGYLTRQYGLSIDNLLGADVVLADGSFVTASEQEHPDLFWALRGGGGNFGVVTSFLFRAHPVSTVYAGPMLWQPDRATDVLRWYRTFMPQAPREVYAFFAFLKVPPAPPFPEALHLQTMCGVVWCHTGTTDAAQATLQEVRQTLPPAFEHVGPVPFLMLQSVFDPLYPPGLQWYWKGEFFDELSDGAIAEHVKHGTRLPTPLSGMHLYPIDGAAHDVASDETAFSYRDATWSAVYAGIDPDPATRDLITTWARDYWAALHPYSAGGGYLNFMMEEGPDRIRATYRNNYERLVGVKHQYDPANLFRVNQNIQPALGEQQDTR